jgi:hypothetical protein
VSRVGRCQPPVRIAHAVEDRGGDTGPALPDAFAPRDVEPIPRVERGGGVALVARRRRDGFQPENPRPETAP